MYNEKNKYIIECYIIEIKRLPKIIFKFLYCYFYVPIEQLDIFFEFILCNQLIIFVILQKLNFKVLQKHLLE